MRRSEGGNERGERPRGGGGGMAGILGLDRPEIEVEEPRRFLGGGDIQSTRARGRAGLEL